MIICNGFLMLNFLLFLDDYLVGCFIVNVYKKNLLYMGYEKVFLVLMRN